MKQIMKSSVKLVVKKETVAHLNVAEQEALKGGWGMNSDAACYTTVNKPGECFAEHTESGSCNYRCH